MAISRRNMMKGILGAGMVIAGGGAAGFAEIAAGAARPLRLTPACDDGHADPTESLTAGPFYTPNTPKRTVLREAGTVGTPLLIEGRVLAPDCTPIAGAVLDFWSCDGNGIYDNEGFKLRGHQYTDKAGSFRLETVKPGEYRQGGAYRTPHVHVKVQGPGTARLTTQLFFPGEPLNAQDGLFRKSLTVRMEKAGGGALAGWFDFVLA